MSLLTVNICVLLNFKLKKRFSIIIFYKLFKQKIMRKILFFIAVFSFNAVMSQNQVTVSTGANYANEVYYNLASGIEKTVPRNSWDISFTTQTYDVSILANNGNGVELYTYPNGDIWNWDDALDIAGIDNWQQMYNSIDNWEGGAFVQNSLGHPDYGWGIYNSVNHAITGDSIFIIKLASGAYKKLSINEKNSSENTWSFKYADLDGSNQHDVILNANNYSDKNFIHYSIENNAIVEQEPASVNWHLLFTRYYDYTIPYFVSGILSNNSDRVVVQEVTGVDQATFNTYDNTQFSDIISTIGSDWKSYVMKGWEVADDVVYFVSDIENNKIYKIYFTDFVGMSTGDIKFRQEEVTTSSIKNIETFATVYPNPSNNFINIIYSAEGSSIISIYDINSKLVYSKQVTKYQKLNKHIVDISSLTKGTYYVLITNRNKTGFTKFIKL